MNHHALLVDFGASRIKSALIRLDDGLVRSKYFSQGSSFFGPKINSKFFADALIEHLTHASATAKVVAIMICCEMHGFARRDASDLTTREYVSWRHSSENAGNIVSDLEARGFKRLTGIRPRSGLPVVTMLADYHLRAAILNGEEIISFLPDEICRLLGHSNNTVHASLAHASGLFTRDNEPLASFGLDEFHWPRASSDDLEKIGHVTFDGRNIPCFGGYGDLQASVAGIQPDKQDWIINLGTGSQIISFIEPALDAFELRQYFQNLSAHCVTHIPAGRALNVWARFFQEVRGDTNPDYFWWMLRSASLQISKANMPAFDLAVFHGAFGYGGGGTMSNIHEDHFGPPQLFAGLLNSFLTQYLDILSKADPKMERPISIAGKMATTMPIIKDWFEAFWNAPVTIQQETPEPTMACMAELAINGLQDRL